MPINMTLKEWEAVPDYWRASRMLGEMHPTPSWSQVAITDDDQGRPYSAVHLDYWKSRSNPATTITIAVWADGEVKPIVEPPEDYAAACHSAGKVVPTRFDIWEFHGSCYSLKNTRPVEMRPVVLP